MDIKQAAENGESYFFDRHFHFAEYRIAQDESETVFF